MEQPALGKRLTALRKAKNLTQQELAEKSHVSVRTIQRIEAGEVLPRMVTVKILLEALGENYESFLNTKTEMETTQNTVPSTNRNTLMLAMVAGMIYLVAEIILRALDFTWLAGDRNWSMGMNAAYTSLTIVLVISFALFAKGFITLSELFENGLLKIAAYMLIIAMIGKSVLDIFSLSATTTESVITPYAVVAVLMGALGIVFGVALIRLQDGMGELSRLAGILEIIMGCLLITVVLFFLTYVILIPAVVVEILVLYRGYEYLTKSTEAMPAA